MFKYEHTLPKCYKNLRLIPLEKGINTYYYDEQKTIFIKTFYKFDQYKIIKREVNALQLLNNKQFDWCPILLHYNYDKHYIILKYISIETLNKINVPVDYEYQITKILHDLKSIQLQHCDIKLTDLLVKDNKLYLCDYAWSTWKNDPSHGLSMVPKRGKPRPHFSDDTTIKRVKEWLNL